MTIMIAVVVVVVVLVVATMRPARLSGVVAKLCKGWGGACKAAF